MGSFWRRAWIERCCVGVLAVIGVLVVVPAAHSVEFGSIIPARALKPQGAYSWLVRLVDTNGATKCSGALVDPTLVLTAAHCFIPGNNDDPGGEPVAVKVGSTDAAIPIVETYTHPEVDLERLRYDVALVRLATAVNANVVALAPLSGDGLTFGDPLTVAGWGLIDNSILPARPYQGTLRYGGTNDLSIMLSSADPSSACPGDSGGPVLQTTGGRPVLVGVTSFIIRGATGFTCGGATTGAMRVTTFADWVHEYTLNVSVKPTAATEPTRGRKRVNVAIRLSRPAPFPISVTVTPEQGSALSGVDYEARPARLLFRTGQQEANYLVSVLGDGVEETSFERLYLRIAADRIAVREPRVPFVIASTANAIPVAVDDSVRTNKNASVALPIGASDPDDGPFPLELTAITAPDGNVTGCPDSCSFQPTSGFEGITTVTYTVSDGLDSAIGTITVLVVGDKPLVEGGTLTVTASGLAENPTNVGFSATVGDNNDSVFDMSVVVENVSGIAADRVSCYASDDSEVYCSFLPQAATSTSVVFDVVVTDTDSNEGRGTWTVTLPTTPVVEGGHLYPVAVYAGFDSDQFENSALTIYVNAFDAGGVENLGVTATVPSGSTNAAPTCAAETAFGTPYRFACVFALTSLDDVTWPLSFEITVTDSDGNSMKAFWRVRND